MSDLIVRRATAEDIPRIQALETEAFHHTWDRDTFLKELSRENGLTVVVESAGEVIGSALLVWAADEAQLNSIVLDPVVRGRGYSRQFLGCLIQSCRQRGLKCVTLEVKWDNPPAQALYERFGFVTIGKRKKYYSDGQDARVMWIEDLQSPEMAKVLELYWRETI